MSDTTLREAIEQLVDEWGIPSDGGIESAADFAEAIQDSGAWRFARDLAALLAEHPATPAEPCGVAYGHNPDPCYLTARHTGPHSNRWGATWAQ